MKQVSLVLVIILLGALIGAPIVSAEDPILAFEKAEYSVLLGKSITLKPVARGIDGNLKYEWSSSDEHVGVIKNGKFQGISAGSSTVTCVGTSKTGQTYEATCVVNVLTPISSISVEASEVEVAQSDVWAKRDASEELLAAFSHTPAITIEPHDASIKTLEWTSSKPNIVTVDENGVITGTGVGTATVTGKAIDGSGKTVKIKVTIPGCYVTEDNITISTPEGAYLGYMYASFGGISMLNYKISGGVVEDAYTSKKDGDMRFLHLVPLKAGKGTITFTRNGRTLKVVKVQVEHSAVYDKVSYPPAKHAELISNPDDFLAKQIQIKCSVDSIDESRVIGVVEVKGERQYIAFDVKEDIVVEVGKTYTFYGVLSELIEYKSETGLTYPCPLLINVVAK